MLNACQVMEALGFPSSKLPLLIPGWGTSQSFRPEDWEALHPEVLRESARWAGLGEELAAQVLEIGRTVAGQAPLRAFLWHVHYKLACVHSFYGNASSGFWGWPAPERILGDKAGLFYVLAVLTIVPRIVRDNLERGIPEDVLQDTLDMKGGIASYRRNHGRPGIDPGVIDWYRHCLAGRLFTLGRFQYKIAELFSFGAMLRHRATGRKILLAEPGLPCDATGFVVQAGAEDDGDWVTAFEENPAAYSGFPVSPRGFVLRERRSFPKDEWMPVLRRGDALLDMHIPPGGNMTPAAALDSFRKAFDFFRRRFPDRFKPAIICRSWTFNTQFEESLPESNLAALMRRCYLFPCRSSGKDGFFFLFGKDYPDPAKAPHDNSVRKAMLAILERGDRLRLGGMLFLQEDLGSFDQETYRRGFSACLTGKER